MSGLGQNLHYHPHIHCIVPGGGISLDGKRWVACRSNFFLPVRVLSRLFRRLFLEELRAAFDAGRLSFFGDLVPLAKPDAFAGLLAEARRRQGQDMPLPWFLQELMKNRTPYDLNSDISCWRVAAIRSRRSE